MAGALINSPAITGPGDSLQQFEDPIELMQAKRKQEIALALLKQLQGGPPQPQQTRILAKTPLMSTLLHAGSQGMAANRLAEADAQIGEITKQQQQAYSQGASELMGSQDQRAAIAKALASSNPQLRALAAAQEKARREAEEKDRERQNSRANALLPVLGQNGMVTEAGNIAASGQVPQGLTRPPVVPPRVDWIDDPNNPGKKIPHQVDTRLTGEQSGTLSGGPQVKIENNLDNKQEGAAAKAFGAVGPEVLKEVRANAQKAISGLDSSQRLLDILKDPQVITGSFAEPRLLLEKIGNIAGFTGPNAIGQTQGLLSELANSTLEQVKRLPGAITEKERPFLQQAAAGSLDYTPEALQRLAEIAQITNHNALLSLQEQYNGAAAAPGVGANAGMYPFPKGWRFQPNEKTMEPQGSGSDYYRLKSGALAPKPPAGSAPKAKPLTDMSDEELQQRLRELQKQRGG